MMAKKAMIEETLSFETNSLSFTENIHIFSPGRKKRPNGCSILKMIGIIIIGFIGYALIYFVLIKIYLEYKRKSAQEEKNGCLCNYKNTRYNMCYSFSINSSIFGKKFGCQNLKVLDDLHLINIPSSNFFDLRKFELPEPVFVTAFDKNRFFQAKHLIKSIRKLWPNRTLIVYDLGLTKIQADFLRNLCKIEYRKFNFDIYPKEMGKITQFRWKPIVIADALKISPFIWYMDATVVWTKSNLKHVYALLNCHKNMRIFNISEENLLDFSEENDFDSDNFDSRKWLKNVKNCQKFEYLLHSYTGHGIYAASHPDLYEFMPTNLTKIKSPRAQMYEAGLALIVRTKNVIENILKWYVLCALEPNCMSSPEVDSHPNGMLGCRFSADRFGEFARCHRYDQSVINILLMNANNYDYHKFVGEITDFFRIDREPVNEILINELGCT